MKLNNKLLTTIVVLGGIFSGNLSFADGASAAVSGVKLCSLLFDSVNKHGQVMPNLPVASKAPQFQKSKWQLAQEFIQENNLQFYVHQYLPQSSEVAFVIPDENNPNVFGLNYFNVRRKKSSSKIIFGAFRDWKFSDDPRDSSKVLIFTNDRIIDIDSAARVKNAIKLNDFRELPDPMHISSFSADERATTAFLSYQYSVVVLDVATKAIKTKISTPFRDPKVGLSQSPKSYLIFEQQKDQTQVEIVDKDSLKKLTLTLPVSILKITLNEEGNLLVGLATDGRIFSYDLKKSNFKQLSVLNLSKSKNQIQDLKIRTTEDQKSYVEFLKVNGQTDRLWLQK